jgi:phage tail-like protein
MPKFTDPFRVQTFYIEFAPYFKGNAIKVSGLSYEREVKQVMQTTRSGTILINQIPARYKAGSITITKVVTKNKGLWDWRAKVMDGKDISQVRVNGTITVYDIANDSVDIKWDVINAWPMRIKGPTINASGDTTQEEIELCYEVLKQAE